MKGGPRTALEWTRRILSVLPAGAASQRVRGVVRWVFKRNAKGQREALEQTTRVPGDPRDVRGLLITTGWSIHAGYLKSMVLML